MVLQAVYYDERCEIEHNSLQTVFDYNWQEEESSGSVCGMYLVRKSNASGLSKLYGGGGDWKKGKLPEV